MRTDELLAQSGRRLSPSIESKNEPGRHCDQHFPVMQCYVIARCHSSASHKATDRDLGQVNYCESSCVVALSLFRCGSREGQRLWSSVLAPEVQSYSAQAPSVT